VKRVEPVGLITRRELEKMDWFVLGQRATSFEGAGELDYLKGQARQGFEVYAFVGSWCSDTRTQAPGFCKLLDQAGLDPARIHWVSLERDKKFLPLTEQFKIEKVPTFIFLKSGVEVGRITETPRGSLLEDSALILGWSESSTGL